jgi:ureidoacrylate peracid hydrolase
MLTHQIEPSTTALIAVDLQCSFVEGSPVAAPDAPAIVAKLNGLAAACRAAGALVVHTAHVIRPDHANLGQLGEIFPVIDAGMLDEESDTAAIHPSVVVAPEDVVVKKPRFGAFTNTDLESILRQRGIDTVIVGGLTTNVCVETTAREASVRDFKTIFLADGSATFDHADGGLGTATAEDVLRVTCATFALAFGEVATVAAAQARIAGEG